jgi:hypothetical protein
LKITLDISLLDECREEINALFTPKDLGLGDKTFHPYHPEEGNRYPPKILTGFIKPRNGELQPPYSLENSQVSTERGKQITQICGCSKN